MYLVTTNHPEYVLFSMTPSGRAAIGLTDKGLVRLLVPGGAPREWRTLREWPSAAYSHTDLMVALGSLDEPEHGEDLLSRLPPETLG
jgi:hypothetical protein